MKSYFAQTLQSEDGLWDKTCIIDVTSFDSIAIQDEVRDIMAICISVTIISQVFASNVLLITSFAAMIH